MSNEKLYTLSKDGEGDFAYTDQDGVSHNSPAMWLWSFLGGCGCGSSESFAERAVLGLAYFGTEHGDRAKLDFNPHEKDFDELLAHWLDAEGFLEHGSSVYSSWLTPKGENVLSEIKKSV